MMLTGTVTDTRKEDKQDGSERSYPGGALGAAAGAVQIGYIKVQPGIMRLRIIRRHGISGVTKGSRALCKKD